MKKSSAGNQTLDLNRIDFERAGSGRKAGYKFSIEFVSGRVSNIISGSPLASDLAAVLLNDPASRAILTASDITIGLNTKFQLSIKNKKATEIKEAKETKEQANGSADELQLQDQQRNPEDAS